MPQTSKRRRRASAQRTPRGCRKLFDLLSDYLDGRLETTPCARVSRHLGGCAPCREFLSSLIRTVETCRRYRPSRLRPQAAARARATLLAEYRCVCLRPDRHREQES